MAAGRFISLFQLFFLFVSTNTSLALPAHPDPENQLVINGSNFADKTSESAATECCERYLQPSLMLTADVLSIAASSLYLVAFPIESMKLLQIGSGVYALNFTLDASLDLPSQWQELQHGEHPLLNRSHFILAQCGEIAAISGFVLLATTDLIEAGSWMVAAGLSLRVMHMAYRLHQHGFLAVFGNDQHCKNFTMKFILENLGGALGSFVLGVGANTGNIKLDYIGACIVGASVGLGSCMVFCDNIGHICCSDRSNDLR